MCLTYQLFYLNRISWKPNGPDNPVNTTNLLDDLYAYTATPVDFLPYKHPVNIGWDTHIYNAKLIYFLYIRWLWFWGPKNRTKQEKIADALDTTVDYLVNGDTDEKAKSALRDSELLQQFKAVEQMNETDRAVIKRLIDAFITKGKIKQLAL